MGFTIRCQTWLVNPFSLGFFLPLSGGTCGTIYMDINMYINLVFPYIEDHVGIYRRFVIFSNLFFVAIQCSIWINT